MNPAARVVPDVGSFSVDDGFWYSVPDHLASDLDIGSIVRVPLSGRRVRGWVVEMAADREGKLKDIAGISGSTPVFGSDLLPSLMWTARHYVAPISALLGRASPPNLPRSIPGRVEAKEVERSGHPLGEVVAKTVEGVRTPVVAIVGNWRHLGWLRAVGPLLRSGSSVLIVAASTTEVEQLGVEARGIWDDLVVTVAGEDDRSDTMAWQSAQSPPRLIIGTPKTSTWQIIGLGLAIVLEEGRRAMKDRQTPTLHVREVMRTRSRLEGFNLVFYGPTPSVEVLSAGAEVVHEANRAWPLVEVVDRSSDQPGAGFLSERVIAAMGATSRSEGRIFVFTHRRVGFASMRCIRCRALRTCPSCGRRLGRVDRCPHCAAEPGPCRNCAGTEFEELGTVPERLVAEINRRVGRGTAAVHPGEASITVGTERDLAGLAQVALAVAADVDGMLLGSSYRTTEEALRQLARLALAVRDGSGHRLMVQTTRPDSLLITTLRRGNPIPYLERVLVDRARDGLPPASEMIALEVRGEVDESIGVELGGLGGVVVMGPIDVPDGKRWLLTGKLGEARLQLRKLVGHWRDRGATVRVDVDPIDL